ncbi:MAG: MarR family winged helix-turn-helix transcriptional regulator [Streptosporangiales bacterium]
MAVRRLLQAGRQMQAGVARRLGVRVTDVAAVDHVVSAEQSLGPVELGHRLGIRSASSTVLVDRLVAAGHLHREPDPADHRRVRLQATEHAREEVREALRPLIDEVAGITDRLDEQQTATVLDFLEQVTAAMLGYATAADGTPARPGSTDDS